MYSKNKTAFIATGLSVLGAIAYVLYKYSTRTDSKDSEHSGDSEDSEPKRPILTVVVGVQGSGKSTKTAELIGTVLSLDAQPGRYVDSVEIEAKEMPESYKDAKPWLIPRDVRISAAVWELSQQHPGVEGNVKVLDPTSFTPSIASYEAEVMEAAKKGEDIVLDNTHLNAIDFALALALRDTLNYELKVVFCEETNKEVLKSKLTKRVEAGGHFVPFGLLDNAIKRFEIVKKEYGTEEFEQQVKSAKGFGDKIPKYDKYVEMLR